MERGKEERHKASRERSWLLTWVGPVRKGGEGRGGEERGERGETLITVYMHIQCIYMYHSLHVSVPKTKYTTNQLLTAQVTHRG